MEKKTITLSNKAFEILHYLIGNEFTDKATDIAFENFDTAEEAEENIRAYVEIFKTFGYGDTYDNLYNGAVILRRPLRMLKGFYYFAEWKRYYEDYDDKSIELVKEITL